MPPVFSAKLSHIELQELEIGRNFFHAGPACGKENGE
jgi:hypothetical protein